MLYNILSSYSEGIKYNMKRLIDNLFLPDEIFTIGKSILLNLI
jgi:hypothetical protein